MPTVGLISGFAFRIERRSRADRGPACPEINPTNSSADKPPFSDSHRISIGWKAQGLRFPRS